MPIYPRTSFVRIHRGSKPTARVMSHHGEVKAVIKYMPWLEVYEKEKPFTILIDVPKGGDREDRRNNNIRFEEKSQSFSNVRGREQEFDLDDHGFVYRRRHFDFDNYTDQASVENTFLSEVEEFLRAEMDGVDQVHFFDWRVIPTLPSCLPALSALRHFWLI